MSLISINNLTFSYDTSFDYIFKDVTFAIDTDWKLGFVGRNGRGKTTFLNLLMGNYEYSGRISHSVPFDYFPFEVADKSLDTLSCIMQAVPGIELWQLLKELNLLELSDDCLYKPFNLLSGGEQSKAKLSALFARENNFLLIDEPTNHLDTQARQLVADYLSKKKGFILVSHDRLFLDKCTDHTLSINRSNIEVQKGNFSVWLENKELRDNFEKAQNEKLMSEIDRLNSAAGRSKDWAQTAHRDSTKNNDVAMGAKEYKRKKAGKLEKQAAVLYRRQENAIEEKSKLLKNIERADELKIAPLVHRLQTLLNIRDLSISYDGITVFSDFDLEINQGDRISLSGKNGCGKSSVLKLILGENINYSGTINKPSGLVISYVPQDTSFLKGYLSDFAQSSQIDETLFKTILAKLDFSKIQFAKDMSEFSAGQKKKVLIAKSLCQKAHLYIWDEPLNYIDILSRIQIEELVKEFNPTMLFVEHDEAFVKKIATVIFRM